MTDLFIIGGDFDLIGFIWEKSSENTDQQWMNKFNGFIWDNGVKELIRKGGRFTWTNKQNNPIISVLDRVLICPRWDQFYRRASCESLTRVGSDHCPLIVNTDDQRFKQQHQFRFEMSWLTQAGFRDLVLATWPERRHRNIQDHWKELKAATRKFCKGWGANVNSQKKRDKINLLEKLKTMDKLEDEQGLNSDQWQERYGIERQLEEIFEFEELQWQRRGGVKWILKGDSNNSYFHGVASGRKKKCIIFSLETEDGIIHDQQAIREPVESYYKDLFGKEPRG
jgi:hypothetical protein